MIEMIASLGAVIGAIILLRFVLLQLGCLPAEARRSGGIRVVETTTLAPKLKLHLVEIEGRRLLLGSTETGIRRLASLPAAASPEVREERGQEADAGAGVESGSEQPRRSIAAGRRRPRLMNLVSGWSGLLCLMAVLLIGSFGFDAAAQEAVDGSESAPTLTLSIGGATDPDRISDTMQIVLVLTAISVAPSILLMATCFTRILIVLALLRQAIGTPTLPPTQILVGLSLMTTIYVMSPVAELVYADALEPYVAREIGGQEAIQRGIVPVRDYLLSHTREEDLRLFLDMKGQTPPETASEVDLSALMPAFMISEIRTAFEIGFMVYLPFLVVDLVIASMLISLGMIMLPPVMIALPFKLMLFVLVDGWNLTLSALVSGLQ